MANSKTLMNDSPTDLLCQIRFIRRTLVTGLASFGEIERLSNQYDCAKVCNAEISDRFSPRHPTGTADGASTFAEALALVELWERDVLKAQEAASHD